MIKMGVGTAVFGLCMFSPITAHAESKEITISAAGDCTLGVDSRYNSNFNSTYSTKGYKYFMKNVKPIFTKDDLTIVNFEGTLTTSKARANKTFTFKGKKSYTKILTSSGIEAVNLANNHTRDFGAKGLKDTKAALKKAKVKYFGDSAISYKNIKGVKVGMIGVNGLSGTSNKTVKSLVKKAKKNGAKLVLVSFHWGIERDAFPMNKQTSYAKAAIDAGADLILGHHPHVLQGISKYKGKYIVYSLGNFCFGGNSNPSDKDTMIFQQTFTLKNNKVVKNNKVKVIPCSISSTSKRNNFQPKIASGSQKKRIMKKINNRSKKFKVQFKSNGTVK